MTNKKVIVIVLVFLIGGLLVYSFAATPSKPLDEDRPNSNITDDDSDKDKENKEKEKQEQEELKSLKKNLDDLRMELEEARKSGKYTDESLAEKEKLINMAQNATTKEEYEKVLEDINNNKLVEKDEQNGGNTITTPINNPSSGNNQTTRPSGDNNQGQTGGNKPTTPTKPSDDNNQGTTGDNNQATTDKPAIVDKNEIANLQNELNNAKNSGKYTEDSLKELEKLIDIANNAKTKEEYEKALEDIKNFELDEKVPTNIGPSNVEITATSNNSSDKVNITSKQEGTDIILGGNIETGSDIENGRYSVRIKVTAPRILSDEVLKNAKFKVMDNIYGVSVSEASAYSRIANIQNIANEKAYIVLPSFSLRQDDIANEAPLKIAVDWGNGEYIIYSIHFNDIAIVKN